MRSILALSLLIALSGVANAAPVHHRHTAPASSFAYAPPPRQQLQDRSGTSDCDKPEAYYGACQGYAPGEKERFLNSVHSP